MPAQNENILYKAQYHPKLVTYYFTLITLVLCITVIGLVAVPIWLIVGFNLVRKHYNTLECYITPKFLVIKKGRIFRQERNIPLEKIQDVQYQQGPLLRYFDLASLKIETAGTATPGDGGNVIYGLTDTIEVRNKILELAEQKNNQGNIALSAQTQSAPKTTLTSDQDVMVQILETLKSIDKKLDK